MALYSERQERTIDWRFILPSQVFMATAWVGMLRVYGDHHALIVVCAFAAVALAALAVSPGTTASDAGFVKPAFLSAIYAALAWSLAGPAVVSLAILSVAECVRACIPRLPYLRRLADALHLVGVSALCQWIVAIGIEYVVLRARY